MTLPRITANRMDPVELRDVATEAYYLAYSDLPQANRFHAVTVLKLVEHIKKLEGEITFLASSVEEATSQLLEASNEVVRLRGAR